MATSATTSSVGASRVSEAAGDGTPLERSPWPREDDWAGEVRAPLPPLPTGEGTATTGELAPSGATVSPFSLFAAGGSLPRRWRMSSPDSKNKSKAEFEYLLVSRSKLQWPPAKLKAQEPLAGRSLGRSDSRGGRTRRAGANFGQYRSRSRPSGDQPRPVLLRDHRRSCNTHDAAISSTCRSTT